MKTSIVWLTLLSLLLLSGPLPAKEEKKPAVTRVTAELRDGSRVVGVFTGKALALTSASVGELKMPVERIRTVNWPTGKTPAQLQATNGDTFSVELRLTELPILSSFGEIKVPVANIRQLHFWTDTGEPLRLPGLVALWSAEGDAREAVSGQTATVVGGVSYVPGKVGQAFSFNGSNGYLDFGSKAGNFGTEDYSIVFWIKTTSTDFMDAVLEKWTGCGDGNMFNIRMGYPGQPVGHLCSEQKSSTSDSTYVRIVSTRAINDGIYHHVALVRQGTKLSFYTDGAFDISGFAQQVANIDNSVSLTAGRSVCVNWDGTKYFSGQMDELALYNRVLSADEIRQLFDAGN